MEESIKDSKTITTKLYSVNQVALILKVHPLTVRRYIKEGKLKALKVVGNVRISQESIDLFVQDIFPPQEPEKLLQEEKPKDTVFTPFDSFWRLKGRGMSLKPLTFNQ